MISKFQFGLIQFNKIFIQLKNPDIAHHLVNMVIMVKMVTMVEMVTVVEVVTMVEIREPVKNVLADFAR